MKTETENANPFRGKRRSATTRLRSLVTLACAYLPAERLNLASLHLACYLDVALGKSDLTGELSRELKREQTNLQPDVPRRRAAPA
jgi:hypothetical protein